MAPRILLGLMLLACAEGPRSTEQARLPFDPGPVPAEHDAGADLFLAYCTGCHGPAGSGFSGGPPLLDTLYLAARFADSSIRRAVLAGAPRGHWNFGDMPPVRTVGLHQLPALIGYLRWVQDRWTAAGTPGTMAPAIPAAGD